MAVNITEIYDPNPHTSRFNLRFEIDGIGNIYLRFTTTPSLYMLSHQPPGQPVWENSYASFRIENGIAFWSIPESSNIVQTLSLGRDDVQKIGNALLQHPQIKESILYVLDNHIDNVTKDLERKRHSLLAAELNLETIQRAKEALVETGELPPLWEPEG